MSNVVKKELPENWVWTTMDNISDVVGGGTPKSKEKRFYQNGSIPWLTPADLSGYKEKYVSNGARFITEDGLNSSSAKIMPAGTVLFTSRAPIGYVVIAKNEICTNQGFKSFVIKSDKILPDYVYWWLKGSKQLAESFASGTTFLELSGSKAKQLPIPIAPLEQQKRIVAKIEELFSHIDAGIEALNKAIQLPKQYRQSVLKAAVTGELTKEWREQNKDKLAASDKLVQQLEMSKKNHNENVISRWEEAKKKWKEQGEIGKRPGKPKVTNELLELDEDLLADLPSLPDTWAWVLLGDIGDAIDPQPSHRTPPKVEDGIPYIGIGDVDKVKGEINFENARKVSSDVLKEHAIRYDLKEGDFIIGKIGTIGKPFQIPIERFYTLSANVVLVCPNTSLIEPGYLFNLCKSPLIEYQFDSGSKATTQAAFGIKKVRLLAVPFCSIEEQKIIVQKMEECLEKAGRLDAELDHQLLKAEKNKQSILASVFRGNL